MYDDLSDRFIATYTSFINYPSGLDESRVHIAMSLTSDPTGYWQFWYSPKTNVYADEPWLGVTSDKVTISSNLFDIDDLSFAGQQTKTYNKAELLAGLSVTETVYPVSGSLFAVRPAQHMTPGNDQIAAMIQGNNLKVFRYVGAGLPTITNVPVAGHGVFFQVASDPGGWIDAGDGRLLDAWVDGNSLWVTTNTSCDLPGASGVTRLCSQIFEVNLTTNTLLQNMTFGSVEDNYYPAARTDAFGNLVAVMNRSETLAILVRAVAVAQGANDAQNSLSSAVPLAIGEVPVGVDSSAPPAPWGAYFGAARDPSNSCVWVVGQYAKDVPGVSGPNDWGTVIARLAHSSNSGERCVDYDQDGAIDSTDPEDDGDGYNDIVEMGSPLCLNAKSDDNFEDTRWNDGCPTNGPAETSCSDNLDSDGDSLINDGCPIFGAYGEGNWSIGTEPYVRCGAGATTGPSTGWPSDLVSGGTPNSTDKINVLDLTSFISPRRLDTRPGDANFNKRWDLIPGPPIGSNWIQIGDLSALFAGSSGFPPMSGGTKVFGSTFTCTDLPPP